MSERAIQTIKNLFRKAFEHGNDPYIVLLEYRNTAISRLKESPAQLLMSRVLKSKLPTSASLLKPRVLEKAQEKLKERSERQKMYYDCNTKPLPQIKEDDTVRSRKRKTWEPAIVSEKHTAPRSFSHNTWWHCLPTKPSSPAVTKWGPAGDHRSSLWWPSCTCCCLHPQLILHPHLLLAMLNYLL